MKKRIFSVVFAVLMLFNIVGCGKSQTVNTNVSKTLPIGEKDFAYSIIYGNDASDDISVFVSKISLAIKTNLKRNVKSKADTKVKYKKENLEILIGATNRPETDKAFETLENNRKNNSRDAIVAVIDNKIVITSKNDEVLGQIVDWFSETFLKDENSWEMLNNDYQFIYEYTDAKEFSIGNNSLLDYSIVIRQDASLVYGTYVEDLQKIINENYCYDISLLTDETEPSEYEIVIGTSSREESKISLEKNQYKIFVQGNKLVVLGSNDEATAFAVRQLCKLLEDKSNTSIPFDYSITENFNPAEDDYKLVYSDEFNTLNTKYWTGYSKRTDGVNQFGKTAHHEGTKHIFIRDGMAVLPAWIDTNTWETYSSFLDYQGNHFWQYGIIEIRAKWAGFASTYSFWFHSIQDDYDKYPAPGITVEYDILENFGINNSFNSNLHRWWKDKGNNWTRHLSLDGSIFAEKKRYTLPEGEEFADKFHTFSCKWSPEEIEFAVDGKVYMRYDLTDDWDGYGVEAYEWPIDRLHITHTIGDASSYNKVLWKEGDPTYYEYVVDYYRLYQRDSDGGFSEVL